MKIQNGFVSLVILLGIVLGIVVLGGGAYLYNNSAPQKSTSETLSKLLLSQGCIKLNDADHLEGTKIKLPEHSNISIQVHCTDPIQSGPGWGGYSSEKVVFRWGKGNARWFVSVGKKVEIGTEGNKSIFLIPFEVKDNLMPFLFANKVASTTEYLTDNGSPDGELSYIGLFSGEGTRPLELLDSVLVGNYLFIDSIDNQNGQALVMYHDFLGTDSRNYIELSLLEHKPLRLNGRGSIVISRNGDRLISSNRHEPAPQPTPSAVPAVISCSITASKTTIQKGESVLLSWKSLNAIKMQTSGDYGGYADAIPTEGTAEVSPKITTKYVHRATDVSKNFSECEVTVVVQ